jgi:hypothetical protein
MGNRGPSECIGHLNVLASVVGLLEYSCRKRRNERYEARNPGTVKLIHVPVVANGMYCFGCVTSVTSNMPHAAAELAQRLSGVSGPLPLIGLALAWAQVRSLRLVSGLSSTTNAMPTHPPSLLDLLSVPSPFSVCVIYSVFCHIFTPKTCAFSSVHFLVTPSRDTNQQKGCCYFFSSSNHAILFFIEWSITTPGVSGTVIA